MFNFFKRKKAGAKTLLPEPGGPLLLINPFCRVEAVNSAVKSLVKKACDEASSSKGVGMKSFQLMKRLQLERWQLSTVLWPLFDTTPRSTGIVH